METSIKFDSTLSYFLSIVKAYFCYLKQLYFHMENNGRAYGILSPICSAILDYEWWNERIVHLILCRNNGKLACRNKDNITEEIPAFDNIGGHFVEVCVCIGGGNSAGCWCDKVIVFNDGVHGLVDHKPAVRTGRNRQYIPEEELQNQPLAPGGGRSRSE